MPHLTRFSCSMFFCLGITLAGGTSRAVAQGDLVVDLSEKVVAITTGFVGSSLLLFGSVEAPGEIVVVVNGPRTDVVVRRKERVAGIWMNRSQMEFSRVPAFYAIASSQPLESIVPAEQRERLQLGANYLHLPATDPTTPLDEIQKFRDALIRGRQRQELYQATPATVTFVGGKLFRTDIWFPSTVAVGTYRVDVYQFRAGSVANVRHTNVSIRKTGAEAEIYEFAHSRGLAYGILAVLIAVMAGWLANLMFRRT
ncbi:MAG: TIGR02186 family protein [Proteobacteria bacterium]|nr:TIGR02186 family protein [Pseudomonadota bacterium]